MADHHSRAVYVISVAAELAGVHPADPAHLRAQGPARPGPHGGRQPPLQRLATSSACGASPS